MLNQSAQYALQAVAQLARLEPGQTRRAAELASALDVPANYLSKILHQLAAAGLLTSRRGRTGGFALAEPAEALSLADVVAPFASMTDYRECLLGQSVCSAATACAAHHRWKPLAKSLIDFLNETTVASLA